jgi:hypothetical protein
MAARLAVALVLQCAAAARCTLLAKESSTCSSTQIRAHLATFLPNWHFLLLTAVNSLATWATLALRCLLCRTRTQRLRFRWVLHSASTQNRALMQHRPELALFINFFGVQNFFSSASACAGIVTVSHLEPASPSACMSLIRVTRHAAPCSSRGVAACHHSRVLAPRHVTGSALQGLVMATSA